MHTKSKVCCRLVVEILLDISFAAKSDTGERLVACPERSSSHLAYKNMLVYKYIISTYVSIQEFEEVQDRHAIIFFQKGPMLIVMRWLGVRF